MNNIKRKNKLKQTITRHLIRILLILLLSILVTFCISKKVAGMNNKILEETASDAFTFQNLLMARALDPNAPSDYTDISSLENSDDADAFVSDTAIKTGNSQYYIRVNYGANCVTILTKDDEGNYTKPYKSMICSSGKSTPKSGTYKISYKYRWLSLYGGVYGQYSTRIVKNILFHSVPYYKQRADSLEYEEYDKLGTTASAGCIRLTVQDAKWIYDNIPSGTYVEFYSDTSNPGPLGKPKAQKISNNTENRNWDPTDPDVNNPWTGGSGIPTITYTPPKTYTQTPKNTTPKETVTPEHEKTTEKEEKAEENKTVEKTENDENDKKENNANVDSTANKDSEDSTANNNQSENSQKEDTEKTTEPVKDSPVEQPKEPEKEKSTPTDEQKESKEDKKTETEKKPAEDNNSKQNSTPEASTTALTNN